MTKVNEKLSQSDIKYNCLIGSTPDVIGELYLDGTISFISQQVHDMLGYHPDEMIGTNIINLTHPDDVLAITKNMKKAIKLKKVVIPKLRLKHKQGNYVLVFVMGKLIKLTDKPGLIGVIRDVTKIYETEKKLEESQNIFEQLNEVFLKFKEDPIFNLQLLVNTAGLLLNADCALFNIFKRINGKDVLESLVTYNEPPNFTRESDPKGHICTDIIKDNPDDVVILRNLDKTDYMKTDENVRNYGLKQYVSYVVRFNNKPTATFCVVYTENREMSNTDITILHILSKSASTELARWNSRIDLQESEEKFKLLNKELEMILDNLPGLVFFKDINNNFIKVNKYVANAHEMTKRELEGLSLFDLYPKDQAQAYWDDDLDVIKSKKPKLNFIEPWDVEEGRRWVNSSKIPLFDENNNCIGIIGLSTDVTVQVKSEQRLRESEEKYRILVETAEMGLVELDFIENRVSYINPKLLKILGYTKDEFFEEKIFIEIVHPEDLENLIRSGEDRHVEFRIYTKDQILRWLSGIRSNQYDEEGKIVSIRLWLEDTTERKEIEEIKSDLLIRFSHEFKTPLISIMGFTDFLLTAYKDKFDKKILSFLINIKNGSERLKALINTFIESSHLDRDFSNLELSSENLLTFIKTAMQEVKGLADLRNHVIEVNVHENLMVEIDKEKIYTVITNLILNAIKYTPIGGKILIRSKIEEDFNSISIIDNGIGFTSSEIEKLFKKFGKIERFGNGWDIITDGIGMGLYISKQIITEHGGKIWVESQGRNRGSTFTFTIPIRKNKFS